MSILITIDEISRRNDLTIFPRISFKPWNNAYTVQQLLDKACNMYKSRNGISGGLYFETLDAPRRVTYAGHTVVIAVGRFRRKGAHINNVVSGVVEVRISGIIPEDMKS